MGIGFGGKGESFPREAFADEGIDGMGGAGRDGGLEDGLEGPVTFRGGGAIRGRGDRGIFGPGKAEGDPLPEGGGEAGFEDAGGGGGALAANRAEEIASGRGGEGRFARIQARSPGLLVRSMAGDATGREDRPDLRFEEGLRVRGRAARERRDRDHGEGEAGDSGTVGNHRVESGTQGTLREWRRSGQCRGDRERAMGKRRRIGFLLHIPLLPRESGAS